MIGEFIFLLILGVALRGAADEQVSVASATARTVLGGDWQPNRVLDGKSGKYHHSDTSNQEQWLKLELTEPQDVGKVIIVNRYISMKHSKYHLSDFLLTINGILF